jgi:hypothetical protein
MTKKKKMAKPALKKAHRIAREIPSGKVDNPYAVGMAAEKKHLRKRHAQQARKARAR